MKDGRSTLPPPPDFVTDELDTRNINLFLGTNYRIEEIQAMPETWIVKMRILANLTNG